QMPGAGIDARLGVSRASGGRQESSGNSLVGRGIGCPKRGNVAREPVCLRRRHRLNLRTVPQVYPKCDIAVFEIGDSSTYCVVALVIMSQITCDGALVYCPLRRHGLCCVMAMQAPGARSRKRRSPAMSARRWAWIALLPAAMLMTSAMAAETAVKFSLDFKFEGPSAPFVLAFDKGYYKKEGLDVSIDESTGSLESIERVASGAYEMGFADINALIKFRDAKPNTPIKTVFMLYNRPPFAVIGRKSRGINNPKDLEGKTLGAPQTDLAYAQWPIFVQANHINASKVTIEHVSF